MNTNIDLSELEMPDKQRRILEAAISISNEKGFSSTTTSEIAKKAGVAEGTIFRYFKTKKDIMHGIMLQAINIATDKIIFSSLEKIFDNLENKDLRTVLREILVDRLELVQRFFPMFRVLVSEALYHQDIRDAVIEKLGTRMDQKIKQLCTLMVENGQLRSDMDPMLLFRGIVGQFIAFISHKMLFTKSFKLSECEKEIDDLLTIIMEGISPK